jgi:hypothetical protein
MFSVRAPINDGQLLEQFSTGSRFNYKNLRLTTGNSEEFGMNRQTLIQKLKDDIAQGRVVTIVGTGVSVMACGNQEVEGCKVATWIGLLEHGVKHCKDIGKADEDDVKLLTDQIQSRKTNFLISAAEEISNRLKDHAHAQM